jgi:hypothetical protein
MDSTTALNILWCLICAQSLFFTIEAKYDKLINFPLFSSAVSTTQC